MRTIKHIYNTLRNKTPQKHLYYLLGLYLLAIALRLINFEHTTFGYDQARDAIRAMEIWSTDPIKIMGPTTDIKGLFHGPLYWYFISPFYHFSHGNPLVAKFFLMLVVTLVVPLSYFFTHELFKNRNLALIASFLMAVSFEHSQYARWLSNPSMALVTVLIFYWGFWKTLNKKVIGIGLMFAAWGLSVQLQFFLMYLAPLFLIGTVYYIKKENFKSIFTTSNIILFALGVLCFSTFAIAEIQFKFQGTQSFLAYFQTAGDTKTFTVPFFIKKYIAFYHSLVRNFWANVLYFYNEDVARILTPLFIGTVVVAIAYFKKYRTQLAFLFIWYLSPIVIYPVEKNYSYFLNVGNSIPLLILVAFILYIGIDELLKPKTFMKKLSSLIPKNSLMSNSALTITFVLLGVITYSNILTITQENVHGETYFSVQRFIDYSDIKNAVIWMYEDNNHQPFTVNTFTNPLLIHTTWAFAFDTIGKPMYGFMPFNGGDVIDGRYAGTNIVYGQDGFDVGDTLYLVVEPHPGYPIEYVPPFIAYENLRSKIVSEHSFNDIVVQKRIITEKRFFEHEDMFDVVLNYNELQKEDQWKIDDTKAIEKRLFDDTSFIR